MRGLILLAGEPLWAQNLSIFSPASPPAESIRSLFVLVLAVTGGIFLVVEGVHLSFSARVSARRRTAAGLRQHADRDRLDGRAYADRLSADPHCHADGI
jgi:heme/copper-type cytochrome/quinol oxidase subunit 2